MKKLPSTAESDANAFNVPDWFRRLWTGTLFGKRKDELILRILKLGGKGLLISRSGLPLDMDTIGAAPAPSVKLLLAVLREAESERKKLEKASSNGESIMLHPEDYRIERTVLIKRKDLHCETEMWTRKHDKHKPT